MDEPGCDGRRERRATARGAPDRRKQRVALGVLQEVASSSSLDGGEDLGVGIVGRQQLGSARGADRPDSAEALARDERADRDREPGEHHRPAMARAPQRHADGPGTLRAARGRCNAMRGRGRFIGVRSPVLLPGRFWARWRARCSRRPGCPRVWGTARAFCQRVVGGAGHPPLGRSPSTVRWTRGRVPQPRAVARDTISGSSRRHCHAPRKASTEGR